MPAKLDSRGTLARNRWDFFEGAGAWGYVNGVAGNTTNSWIVLFNNGMAGVNLDVWYASFSTTPAAPIVWATANPGVVAQWTFPTPIPANAVQLNQSAPPGVVGIAVIPFLAILQTIRDRVDSPSFDELKLGFDGPFVTVPPGYALVATVAAPNQTASATFFYQAVLDQSVPAGT